MLARIDDPSRPGYPGVVLALIPGEFPLLARRVNYFASSRFAGYFDPHPNHPLPLTLAELAARPTATYLPGKPPFADRLGYVLGKAFGLFLCAAAIGGVLWLITHWATLFGTSPTPVAVTGSAPAPAQAQSSSGVTYDSGLKPRAAPAAAPAPPSAPAPVNAAYDQGVTDWRALQAWFTTQSGDRRAGADWWAAHRSHNPGPCDEAAEDYSDNQQAAALFEAGCKDAKAWLDPIDVKRADPQYKAGFNDEAKRDPLN
jgi:hypothetical protein